MSVANLRVYENCLIRSLKCNGFGFFLYSLPPGSDINYNMGYETHKTNLGQNARQDILPHFE